MSEEVAPANHRLATRMAALAFLSQNITMSAAYAPFSVLLMAVEARYGVTRSGSSIALALMSASLAVCAPVVGILVERISARLLMMLGSVLGVAGYAILALSNDYGAYLVVYGLFFGPAICLGGVVTPSTLMTRWFVVKRGRALGIVHMPLLMGPLALAVSFLLRAHGLPVIYGMLSIFCLAGLIASAFVIDNPPGSTPASTGDTAEDRTAAVLPVRLLVSDRHFWRITVAFAACIAGTVILGAHLVPMARGWGIPPSLAASLVLVTSLAGLIGNPVLGWITDRLGAGVTMALLCLDCALLWALLLLQPAYPVLALIVFALGLHGGATMAVFSTAVAEQFGQAAFSRAFGLSKLLTLPFTLLAIPAAAAIYVRTGTYAAAVSIQACFFLAAGLAAVAGHRSGARRTSTPARGLPM